MSKLNLKIGDFMEETYITLGIMMIAFFPAYFVLKRLLSLIFAKFVTSKQEAYNVLINKYSLNRYLFHLFFSFYLIFCLRIFERTELFSPFVLHIKDIVISSYAVACVTLVLISLINIFESVYDTKSISSRIPISLHAHILKIIITLGGILIIVSYALDLNLNSLFASLGAAAAVVTFIFKDAVLGLFASLQLTAQKIINIDDWITVPSYGADGKVESITVTVIKVRNFDKTISTIPTHALIEQGIRNYQPMKDSGARRIKRSIFISCDSIKACSQEDLNKYAEMEFCSNLKKQRPDLFIAENEITNMTIFRHYMYEYLISNNHIYNEEDFPCMIRTLEPTSTGVPLQFIAFVRTTDWKFFEDTQSDIFDHIFWALPVFRLRMFQYSCEPI